MITPRAEARRAAVHEAPALAAVLRDAFRDYPWTRWTIPPEEYDERLETLQHAYLGHAFTHGGRVWVTAELDAVAVFVPATMPEPATEVAELIVAAHGDRLDRLVAHESAAAGARPDHDWSLATAGVLPSRRGQGRGTAVLRAGLDDLVGHRVLLETSEPANVRLYRRLGFQVAAEVAGDGPPVWVMLSS